VAVSFDAQVPPVEEVTRRAAPAFPRLRSKALAS
jgi:hypothetical protein